ncbi:GntR family transcriptional regulator [Liquorilactobacillus mali]|uniref:GntR family transcriptional regulator n=2 Tax=Liquorilactobacillus mali TaxID=1618 RepID=J0KZ52_9LACO|nr:GntR family transcriptional regulator [Liquorilactobacillus mali KCTC 3596 = DSM 20444]KRN09125.1 GntR family transcriptional regulator [Liquorilactobacillus mali KCTC 3596 = DSM 20444]MDV7757819.1 GntR family transcriptional regulator [Liquorilactobacillus mali]QFQ73908.1 GntR family transcriptional regulator [Liquorilactobacillus mali]
MAKVSILEFTVDDDEVKKMHFNFNSTEPIYLQVASQIEEAIFTKNYAEEEQIPSTTEISRDFHINPATVLKGINLLVSDGLVEKKRGIGMFVAQGAYEKLVRKRRELFYQDEIVQVVDEAKRLQISKEELLDLIKRGF